MSRLDQFSPYEHSPEETNYWRVGYERGFRNCERSAKIRKELAEKEVLTNLAQAWLHGWDMGMMDALSTCRKCQLPICEHDERSWNADGTCRFVPFG